MRPTPAEGTRSASLFCKSDSHAAWRMALPRVARLGHAGPACPTPCGAVGGHAAPFWAFYRSLCFNVLGAFLPSVPGRARDADPQIKTPPDRPRCRPLAAIGAGTDWPCRAPVFGGSSVGARVRVERGAAQSTFVSPKALFTQQAPAAPLSTTNQQRSKAYTVMPCINLRRRPVSAFRPYFRRLFWFCLVGERAFLQGSAGAEDPEPSPTDLIIHISIINYQVNFWKGSSSDQLLGLGAGRLRFAINL